MFCSNCGNEVTEFDKFCTKCGSEVSHSKQDTSVPSTEAQDVSVQSGATEQPVAGESATPESPAPATESSAAPAPAAPAATTPAVESPAAPAAAAPATPAAPAATPTPEAAPTTPAAPTPAATTPATESPAAPASATPAATPAASAAAPTPEAAPTTPAAESPVAPASVAPAPTQEATPFATVSQAPNQELTSPPQKKSRIGTGVIIGVAGSIITVLVILLVAGFLMSTEENNTHTDTEVVDSYDDIEYDWEYDWDTEYDWDDLKVADANGNVTGYACINLNGEDLVEVMLENDYAWSYLDECYLRSSDLAAVGFMDTTGELLSRDEILALQEGAANEPVMIINSVGGYDSLTSAFNGALGVDLSDSAYGDEELILGILENDYGEQYLVIAFAHGDGTYDLCFLNDSGVAGGLFYDLTGASGYTSVAEVWSDITSGSLYIDEDYEDTVSTTGTIVTTRCT